MSKHKKNGASNILDSGFMSLIIFHEQIDLLEEIDEDTRLSCEYTSTMLLEHINNSGELPPDLLADKLKDKICNLNWCSDERDFRLQKKIHDAYVIEHKVDTNQIIPLMKYFYHEKDFEGYVNLYYLAFSNGFMYRYYYFFILFYFTQGLQIKKRIVDDIIKDKGNIDILDFPYMWFFSEIEIIVKSYYPDPCQLIHQFSHPSVFSPYLNKKVISLLSTYPKNITIYAFCYYTMRKEFIFVRMLPKCIVSLDDLYESWNSYLDEKKLPPIKNQRDKHLEN
jgi:hypothetical protein